ncbi:hypothetical protein [Spirosoma validum]|uniref:Uncharacterized protein n=1 Tax=Spirosoma validum TaxID=2771355 RepID=A0A927AX66_9BACT|nr:hypothetical protein [Spirosoma validum]MBD2751362.1 hypothetical protein [Spirosoma validum]
MKKIVWLAQNKRASKYVFWVLAFLIMISNHVLPAETSNEEKDLVQYGLLALTIVWAVIYQLVPRQETMEELKKRHRGMAMVILAIVTAFLVIQLYDHVYFLPKVKARVDAYEKARSASGR